MRRLKAENITAQSVDLAVLPPPMPKIVKRESTGRPPQGKQAGLKMAVVPMPKTEVKEEETKASDPKAEAASVAKSKAEERKTSRESTEVELKPAKSTRRKKGPDQESI